SAEVKVVWSLLAITMSSCRTSDQNPRPPSGNHSEGASSCQVSGCSRRSRAKTCARSSRSQKAGSAKDTPAVGRSAVTVAPLSAVLRCWPVAINDQQPDTDISHLCRSLQGFCTKYVGPTRYSDSGGCHWRGFLSLFLDHAEPGLGQLDQPLVYRCVGGDHT